MQVNGISSISAITPIGTSSGRSTVTARPAVTAAPGAAPATGTTTPQTAVQPVSTVRSGGAGGGGGAGAAAAAASALAEVVTAYSTTIGGKSYSGSVEESDGVYEASIPNLPGASASGASAELAEANLDTRISLLA